MDDRLEVALRADVGEDGATRLAAFRVVIAALRDPSAELSVSGLAKRTLLTRDQVARALKDDEFQAMLSEAMRIQVGGLISRALGQVERILESGKVSPKDTAAILRALTATHTALAASNPKQDARQAEDDLEALLRRLKPANVTLEKTAKAT